MRNLIVMLAVLVWGAGCRAGTPKQSSQEASRTQHVRLRAYHQAKLWALDQEIQRHRAWIQNTQDPQRRLAYQKALARLQVERERWIALPADSVALPKDSVQVVVTLPPEGCRRGLSLPYEGLTRSGPFYIVAGIVGDACRVLKPKHRYRLTLVPVLPQAYPFPSSYVCIVAYEELNP